MVLNRDGLVFIGQRRGKPGADPVAPGFEWQMPQGGIDRGEAPLEAARRELLEETNISSVELLAEAPEWYSYDLPNSVRQTALRGRFRGQKQKWFAFRFVGDEAEIDLQSPGGGHKPEFVAWRWEHMARVPELIVPFKRSVYDRVVATFGHLATRV